MKFDQNKTCYFLKLGWPELTFYIRRFINKNNVLLLATCIFVFLGLFISESYASHSLHTKYLTEIWVFYAYIESVEKSFYIGRWTENTNGTILYLSEYL